MAWTEERIERARHLYVEARWSASRVAGDLGGGCTRNAVISLSHRKGWVGGTRKARPLVAAARAPRQPRAARVMLQPAVVNGGSHMARGTVPVLPLPPEPALVVPVGQRCTLLELGAGKCRWPVGEPHSAEFFFCGGDAPEGQSYCRYHHDAARQPTPQRRGPPRPWR